MPGTPPAMRLVPRVAEHMPQTEIWIGDLPVLFGIDSCTHLRFQVIGFAGRQLSRSRIASVSIAADPMQLLSVAPDMLMLFVHFQDLV
jgi:hypothetical protein